MSIELVAIGAAGLPESYRRRCGGRRRGAAVRRRRGPGCRRDPGLGGGLAFGELAGLGGRFSDSRGLRAAESLDRLHRAEGDRRNSPRARLPLAARLAGAGLGLPSRLAAGRGDPASRAPSSFGQPACPATATRLLARPPVRLPRRAGAAGPSRRAPPGLRLGRPGPLAPTDEVSRPALLPLGPQRAVGQQLGHRAFQTFGGAPQPAPDLLQPLARVGADVGLDRGGELVEVGGGPANAAAGCGLGDAPCASRSPGRAGPPAFPSALAPGAATSRGGRASLGQGPTWTALTAARRARSPTRVRNSSIWARSGASRAVGIGMAWIEVLERGGNKGNRPACQRG